MSELLEAHCAEIAGTSDPVLAVFDLDKTLSVKPTLVRFVATVLGPVGFTLVAVRAAAHLVFGRDRAKERLVELALGGMESDTVTRIAARYAQRVMDHGLSAEALRIVRAHQAAGHVTAIVSAALGVYVEPLGELLGVDAVEATRVSGDRWVCEGRFEGAHCSGAEKVLRVVRLQERFACHTVWAYGDSSGDRAMLRHAQRGVWMRRGRLADRPRH